MHNVIKFDGYISLNSLYKTYLLKFNDLLNSGKKADVIFDFRNLEGANADVFIPLLRAMCVLGERMQQRYGSDTIITLLPSNKSVFLFLHHVGMWNLLKKWYVIPDEELHYLEYNARDINFNDYNKILELPDIQAFKELIEENNLDILDSIKTNEVSYQEFIRSGTEGAIYRLVKIQYEGTLNKLLKHFGIAFQHEITSSLCELAANSVYHGGNETFIYFQINTFLPYLTEKKSDKKTRGLFISVGDLGKGLRETLRIKENDYDWDRKSFENRFEDLKNIFDKNKLMVYEEEILDLRDIVEAIEFSYIKENNENRYGLYHIINSVTENADGVVSICSGKLRLTIDSLASIDELIYESVREILYLVERRHVSLYQKKIKGLQVDVEIKGEM